MKLPVDVILLILGKQAWSGRQLSRAFRAAVAAGQVNAGDPDLPLWALQQMWRTSTGLQQQPRLLKARALAGDAAGVLWLTAEGCPCKESAAIIRHAAKTGNLPLLEWCRSVEGGSGQGWHAGICAVAARHGQLEALQWLRAQTPPW